MKVQSEQKRDFSVKSCTIPVYREYKTLKELFVFINYCLTNLYFYSYVLPFFVFVQTVHCDFKIPMPMKEEEGKISTGPFFFFFLYHQWI